MDLRTRFTSIRSSLALCYREREDAIECMMLAALSGSHALLVGPPGTAKSALFLSFLSNFPDARKFLSLVTKFGTEDQYFGPVKLSALKNDVWERNLDGRLAGVEVAFLDEVFKGSDSILNTLLSAMNERTYNGKPIPLRMMVAASNELPEEELLAAIYDRFLLRDVVDYIGSDQTWVDLVLNQPSYAPAATVSLAEWETACAEVRAVKLSDGVVREMLRIRSELKASGTVCSDRRWIAMTRVLRAAAWLDGETEVQKDQLAVLKFGLWNKPEERARVVAVLSTVDRSAVAKAVTVIDAALQDYAARPADPAKLLAAVPALAARLTNAGKEVQAMLAAGVSKRAEGRIKPRMAELAKAHAEITAMLAKRYALNP